MRYLQMKVKEAECINFTEDRKHHKKKKQNVRTSRRSKMSEKKEAECNNLTED